MIHEIKIYDERKSLKENFENKVKKKCKTLWLENVV